MKVLVTGADGFIGSHLTELLLAQGYEVRALSLYNSFNSWGWLNDIPGCDKLDIVSGDIRDPHFCNRMTQGIDIVYHLAALIAIPYSYLAPDSYFDTNIRGTLNMCHASLSNGVKRFIHTSTSEVYGTARYVPIDEKHPKQPQSPYSASKIGADAIALSFHNSFGLPVVIVRPFNTYGPRQSARAFIPTIITQIIGKMKEIRTGDLSTTRDFNYVKDTCKGFLLLSRCDEAVGEEINISSNSEISMLSTLEMIASILNAEVKFIEDPQRIRPANSEVFRLWGDNSKIKRLTGFRSDYNLERGLRETIKWYIQPENLKKFKIHIYNI